MYNTRKRIHRQEVAAVVNYNVTAYDAMLGNISQEFAVSTKCVSQCTGCKCSCKCSCSGGVISDFEWEEM